MKTILFGIILFLSATSFQAQNTNVKDATKTTTTTISTTNGDKTYIKKENTREIQNVELKEEKPNTVNMETKDSPIQVTTSTKITNPDGTTRTVDIDRSNTYVLKGKKFKINLDANGYRMLSEDKKTASFLRKTTNNSFIYQSGNKTAIGYFDLNNNLILETYNPKTDSVSYETYTVIK